MGYKEMKDLGTRVATWEDVAGETMLKVNDGEAKTLRFVGTAWQMKYHWVPWLQKVQGTDKDRVKWFPMQCHNWDDKKDEPIEDGECPACNLGLRQEPQGVFRVIDVDALYAGKKAKAMKLFRLGDREINKLLQQEAFNKVKGEVKKITDEQYGCVIMVSFDKGAKDKALKWAFSKGERLAIKIDGDHVKVKIPEDAESDLAGKVVTLEIPDVEKLTFLPPLKDMIEKFRGMRCKEGVARINKERAKKDEDEGREPPSSKRRRDDDEDDEPAPKKKRKPAADDDFEDDEPPKKKRKPADDDDEEAPPKKKRKPVDDDDEDEAPPKKKRKADDFDEDEDEEPAPKKKRKADDDDLDEDDDEPAPKKKPAKKGKSSPPPRDEDEVDDDFDESEDEDDEDEKPAKKKAKKKPADDEDDF